MLILFETPAGFTLFKVLDEKKLQNVDDLHKSFKDGKINKLVQLQAFSKFKDTTEALAEGSALVEAKVGKGLKEFLTTNIISKNLKDKLAVMDPKLATAIKKKTGIKCIFDNTILELQREIRNQLESLMPGMQTKQMSQMALGLSHCIARYKLKFSPEKVDNMIVQAIALLDDLDKEINTYGMRVKEWYGWHFPEMVKVCNDNQQYSKIVLKMGVRAKAVDCDFSDIVEEQVERDLKEAAIISMGTEISDEDVLNISLLARRVLSMSAYRSELHEYLVNRMRAIAPNLTTLVGEQVGARLIAHAGSLVNLAKYPASTIQILGAEKALFRALKTKRDTPKFGLIYHASLIGMVQPKFKGKIARAVAAKCALSVRVDALGEKDSDIGEEGREKILNRIAVLEGNPVTRLSGAAKSLATPQKYDASQKGGLAKVSSSYNPASDSTLTSSSKKTTTSSTPVATVGEKRKREEKREEPVEKKEKKEKKDKKQKKQKVAAVPEPAPEVKKEKKKEKKDKKDKKQKKEAVPEPKRKHVEVEEKAEKKKSKSDKKKQKK